MTANSAAAVEQLTAAFYDITDKFLKIAEQNIDLARALGDQETLVKEQIKLATMKSAVGIFKHCYQLTIQQGRPYEQ